MEKEYLVLADQLGAHWPRGSVIRDSLLGTYEDTPEGRFVHDKHVANLLSRGMIKLIEVAPAQPEEVASTEGVPVVEETAEVPVEEVAGVAAEAPAAEEKPAEAGEMLPPAQEVKIEEAGGAV